MNVFILGLQVASESLEEDGSVYVTAQALPSTEKKISTKVLLVQKADHYVGKLLSKLPGS